MRIDLRRLIKDLNLDRAHLSKVLFPNAKHPAMAMTRLLAGRSKLTEEQIYRLSVFTGLSIDALYAEAMYWKKTAQGGLVRFTTGDFTAIFSPSTGITKLYHHESLFATHVLSSPNQPLAEYLSELNSIVTNKQINK